MIMPPAYEPSGRVKSAAAAGSKARCGLTLVKQMPTAYRGR